VDAVARQEYRYRAVREVLAGASAAEAAARFGASRQSVHAWRCRFEAEGLPGLADRSRRPLSSPGRLDPEVEASICELRREHPRWGARRIAFELLQREMALSPARSTVH
jgi:transposase